MAVRNTGTRRARRAIWPLAAGALALLALAVGGLLALGSQLSAPAPRVVGRPPAALDGAYEVGFASGSGSTLRGWLAPGQAGAPCVVLAHAIRGDRRGVLGRAVFLHRAGYGVLLFDAQAHGESPGEQIAFGMLEAFDAAAAVAFAREACGGGRVAYVGVSLGGAAALLGDEPLDVDALVLEAVYPTLERAIENRLAIRLGEPGRWLAPLLSWQVEPRLGIPLDGVSPLAGAARARAPVFVIGGDADEHTTAADTRALHAAAPEPKRLWIVPGAAHVDLHAYAPAEYERRVLAFLSETVPLGAAGR